MNANRFALILVLTAVSCCVVSPMASSQNLTDEWVEKTVAPLVENRVVDGLSIGYIEGDHWGIVHLGTANAAKEKANNLTVYELGSISKVFTSLLLADAVVRNEINLYAPADVPNAAGIHLPLRDGRAIKWIDLSTHRSGLPRLPGNMPVTDLVNPYRDYDSKKAAAFVNQYKLPRKPGDAQEYSNIGASILGYLVAQKAGKSYNELLREKIAIPLRMSDCTVSLSTDQAIRLATPHSKFGAPTPPWDDADMPGAGGVYATMRDMMRFAKAQISPPAGTLGDAIELAWKQQSDADKSGPATGLGWMIAGDGETRWHDGGTGGTSTALFVNRRLKCATIVLCNTSVNSEIDNLAIQLIQKVAGVGATAEKSAGKVAIDAKDRARLVGRYELAPDFIFDVEDQGGHLMVGVTNQPTLEVFPDSPTRWSYHEVDAKLEFNLPKTGPATSLVLVQNGARQTARRMKTSDPDPQKVAVDSKLRARLVGRYQLAPDFIFTVHDENGHLMVDITNQPTQEVFPDSATKWSYHGIEATLEFKLPKAGPAKSLVLHQNGASQTARRIN
jgi:CubicO group peptidase (beta-lactamase class C family)